MMMSCGSVEAHDAGACVFVTFCSALSQHHVVKRFFFDTERSFSQMPRASKKTKSHLRAIAMRATCG